MVMNYSTAKVHDKDLFKALLAYYCKLEGLLHYYKRKLFVLVKTGRDFLATFLYLHERLHFSINYNFCYLQK